VAEQEGGNRGHMARSIGFELRKTNGAVEGDLQARLAGAGIQIGMWLYLRSLWFEDGPTQSELSRRVGASKPTTLEQLRRIERRGLVTLQRAASDRRLVRVFLTAEGKALKAMLLPFARLNNNAALAGFSEAEIAALLDALRRIRHNVEREQPRQAARISRALEVAVERRKRRSTPRAERVRSAARQRQI
jgi:DNA-binding MarR family transcriptional regulator